MNMKQGCELRHKKKHSLQPTLSYNSLVVEKLIFEYGCGIKAVL